MTYMYRGSNYCRNNSYNSLMRYFSELFATIILAQTIKKHFIKMAINGFLPDYIPNRTWNCILNQIQNNSYCSSAKQHWFFFSTQRRFWFILNKLSSVSPEHYIRITSFSLIINFSCSYFCALGVCFYFVLVWGFFVCGGFICIVLDDSDWLLFGILLFQNLQIKHQSADHIYHIHIW